VDGIEVDPRAARCAGAFCRAVYVGSLEDPSFLTTLTGCYDRILFGDVLEHLVDPESVLRNVVRLLAPEGRILVSLPNIAYWQIRLRLLAGQFAYAESGILDRTHVRFFTYNTARELAGAAGLRIVEHTFTSRLPGTNLAPWLALPVARAFPNLFAYQTLMELEPCPA
jgi:SAM-dependent methyltransferase